MKEKSKTQDVLNHLKIYGSIELMKDNKRIRKLGEYALEEAVEYYNLYRLSSVIYALKKRGYEIKSEIKPFVSKYGISSNFAVYHLIGE